MDSRRTHHEEVGAEYVSSSVARLKRTQFIAVDDIGETFHKRYYDERLGWHETTVSREAVRDGLTNRLTRLPGPVETISASIESGNYSLKKELYS